MPTVGSLCTETPCLNGGTCLETNDTRVCSCVTGYKGKDCQTGKVGDMFVSLGFEKSEKCNTSYTNLYVMYPCSFVQSVCMYAEQSRDRKVTFNIQLKQHIVPNVLV